VSTIYFIRHGQAGQRDDYDRLSDLGGQQARLLGEHLCQEGLRFDAAIVGGLRRQEETADIVLGALKAAGLEPPRIESDVRWNEFDLDEVYAGIAPRIAADDEEFRASYDEIKRLISAGDGHIHRNWTPADTRVVKEWIVGRYEFEGESWARFTARVKEAGTALAQLPAGTKTAVFTSATPVSIWVAAAFGSARPAHVMRLAGAAINTNLTLIEWRDGEPHLGCFNAIPHLMEPALRTRR